MELDILGQTTQRQNANGTAYKVAAIVRHVMDMASGVGAETATGGMTGGVAGAAVGSMAAQRAGGLLGGMQARSATTETASLAAMPVSDLVRLSLQVGTNVGGNALVGR